MKKTIIFAVFAVLVAGCISGTDDTIQNPTATTAASQSSPTSTTLHAGQTTTTVSAEDVEVPTTMTIRLPANITNCLTLDNITYREACYYDVANREKDITVCDKIGAKNLQLKCRARLEENPDLCGQIDTLTEKDWCYSTMAFKWNKIKYCKMIFYQPLKDKCVLDFVLDKKSDPMECFGLADLDMRDKCIYYHIDLYVNKTGAEGGIKPKLCGLISNMTLQVRCNQTYLNQKF